MPEKFLSSMRSLAIGRNTFISTTKAHKILLIVLKVAMTMGIFNLSPNHPSWFISGQCLQTSFAKTGLMMSLYYQLSR